MAASRNHFYGGLVLAALCVLAYGPSLALPLISDDYLQVALAREYGPVSGWAALAADPLYRCRATSLVMTWWLEQWFGIAPIVLGTASLVLHLINTCLVAAFSLWRRVPAGAAFVGAAFFAVYEGHQEAVIWFAAVPELLVFLFVAAALLFWIGWVQQGRWSWYGACAVLYLFALLSKESAVALPGLMALVALIEPNRRRTLLLVIPFALVAAAYTIASFVGSANHQHYSDGTFSLRAPFLWTLLNSTLRMLWFWGLVAVGALGMYHRRRALPLLGILGAAAAASLLPYSFLTYMPRVPSRHTYLASAALALMVGFAWVALRRAAVRQALMATLASAVIVHNCTYLWLKKQQQFARRAAPTERLREFGQTTPGAIRVRCFPYPKSIAVSTLKVGANRTESEILFGEPNEDTAHAADFCYHDIP